MKRSNYSDLLGALNETVESINEDIDILNKSEVSRSITQVGSKYTRNYRAVLIGVLKFADRSLRREAEAEIAGEEFTAAKTKISHRFIQDVDAYWFVLQKWYSDCKECEFLRHFRAFATS